MAAKQKFKKNDWVVYPTHGVGRVTGIEKQKIEEELLQLIDFPSRLF